MQIEKSRDMKLLRKMIEAGAAHAKRIVDALKLISPTDALSKEFTFELEEVHFELRRAEHRLKHLEKELEDIAS